MTNFVQEANYSVISNSNQREDFDISNSNQGDLTDMTEEDYWYSVERDRYKEQLEEEELRDYEDSEEKEYYKYYYGDLKEENMSKKEHEFILHITENFIRECAETELDYASVEKMVYNIYPRVCALFNKT